MATPRTGRPRGRPAGWRAVPGHELEQRVAAARVRLEGRGERATQRAIAALLGVGDRTLRRYLEERSTAA